MVSKHVRLAYPHIPFFAPPRPEDPAWDEPGSGYAIVAALGRTDPIADALAVLADHRSARATLFVDPHSIEAAPLTDEIRRIAPRHVCFVVRPEDAKREFVRAVNEAMLVPDDVVAGAGPYVLCSFGFLPIESPEQLLDYVRRSRKREEELRSRVEGGRPRKAVFVSEEGAKRSTSSLCRTVAEGLAALFSADGIETHHVRHDNEREPATSPALEYLPTADVVTLIGHGKDDWCAGIDCVPDELLAGPVIINGTCAGASIHRHGTLCNEFLRQGALVQYGSIATTGLTFVLGALVHLYGRGLSAGEAWRRNLTETHRYVAEVGTNGQAPEQVAATRGARNGLHDLVLVGDPAFVPFPLGEDRARTKLEEISLGAGD